MRTTVTFEGDLADDPQVRFTPSGQQITEITVLVNERRPSNVGGWVDGEPTRHVVKALRTLGEDMAESLEKGHRVFVHRHRHHRGLDRQGHRGQAHCAAGDGGGCLGRACAGQPPASPSCTRSRDSDDDGAEVHHEVTEREA